VSKIGPVLEAIHERLARVTIERLPWSDFIMKYDWSDALFYLDPPYYGCEGDYGKDLFDRAQFPKIAAQLATINGRFLLSLNDHPDVRRIFAAFAMVAVDVSYSISGGNGTAATELIISNLDQEELERVLAEPGV
jgi:DNA adenine methylase